jgi:hypothetical protein
MTMHIELRRIKVFEEMSRETEAFTAELWVDGKKLGHVMNDGGGGASNIEVADRPRLDAVEAYAAALPSAKSDDFAEGLPMDLDFYLALLLERHLEEKHERALCQKHIVLQLKNAPPGQYACYKEAYSPQAVAALRKRHGENLLCIVNDRYRPGAPVRPLYEPARNAPEQPGGHEGPSPA